MLKLNTKHYSAFATIQRFRIVQNWAQMHIRTSSVAAMLAITKDGVCVC